MRNSDISVHVDKKATEEMKDKEKIINEMKPEETATEITDHKEKKPNRKKKAVIGIVAAVVVIAVAVGAGVYLYNPLDLRADTVTVEFGEKISTDAASYLTDDVDKDIVKKTEVSYKADPVEGEEYDQVGDYTVTLKYGKKEKTVAVTVEDTVKPEFNNTAEAGIETIAGVKISWKKYIKATDLAGVDIKFDDKGVDIDKAGSYKLIAVATDKNGNETTKEISVKVLKKPDNMTGSTIKVDKKTGKVTVTAQAYTESAASGSYGGSSGGSYSGGASGYSSGSGSSGGSSSGGSGGSTEIDTNWNYAGEISNGRWAEESDEFVWPEDWD